MKRNWIITHRYINYPRSFLRVINNNSQRFHRTSLQYSPYPQLLADHIPTTLDSVNAIIHNNLLCIVTETFTLHNYHKIEPIKKYSFICT